MLASAFIGLGSNLGDRESFLAAARAALDRIPDTRVVHGSAVIETEPVDAEGGTFLNQVLEVMTAVPPVPLLHQLLAIENQLGRVRTSGGRLDSAGEGSLREARVIDLDLLWYAGLVLRSPDLYLPHPRMRERIFVLGPLLEIAPNLGDPITGRRYREFRSTLEP